MSKFGFPEDRGIGNRVGGFIGNTPSVVSGIFGLRSQYKYADIWPPVSTLGLYNFTSFTFTNGTQTGRFGPSLSNLLSAYDTNENPWLNDTEFFSSDDGIQLWTVPATGTYRIEAFGAGTDHVSNQRGARLRGDFSLEEGDVIRILVGQQGTNFRCGSGGTFVVKNTVGNPTTNDILVIAGGNGGYSTTNHAIMQGTTSNNGQNSVTSSGTSAGGTNGGGGGQGGSCFAQSGAGFSGNGLGCDGAVAQSFLNGGVGAVSGNAVNGEGGFGGGGTGRDNSNWRIGGGGGYSGGASAGNNSGNAGGGGGSFNSGTNQDNESGAHAGHGKVEITFLG